MTDALDELIGDERIDPQLAMKVLTQFDRIIAETLQEKVKARLTFKVITINDPGGHDTMRQWFPVACWRALALYKTLGICGLVTSMSKANTGLRFLCKQGSLDTYRFCDEVWTFLIRNVTFKLDNGGQTVQADKVKIVSCSAKRADDK